MCLDELGLSDGTGSAASDPCSLDDDGIGGAVLRSAVVVTLFEDPGWLLLAVFIEASDDAFAKLTLAVSASVKSSAISRSALI